MYGSHCAVYLLRSEGLLCGTATELGCFEATSDNEIAFHSLVHKLFRPMDS
jgi:hypothetical protein